MLEEDYIGNEPKIPGKPTSLWIDTTINPKFPNLTEDLHEVDVAIVGGGMVGVMSGFLLALAGQKVVILESREVLADVTGHTTAKLTFQHGLIYDYLRKNFGKGSAADYLKGNQTGLRLIDATIKEYDIKCDYKTLDSFVYTEDEDILTSIKKEVEAAQELGINATFEEEIDLPFAIRGAVRFADQAQFHPRKYLFALLNIIRREGGAIYENTRVTEIEDGNICEVSTPLAKVYAKKVIVATNFPIYDEGKYFSKMEPRRSYVIATTIDQDIPLGLYYGIEKEGFRSFRSAPVNGRELFFIGGEPHKAGENDNIQRYLNLIEYAQEKFKLKTVDYHWSTQDNMPLDQVPYVGLSPDSKNVYFATGFSGWGMSSSAMSAILLTNMITGKETSWADIFSPKRAKPIKDYLSYNFKTFKRLVSDKRKKDEFQFLTEIKEGEGRVVDVEGEKLAVFRDKEGNFHYLSPECTHKGCIVNWNNAEKTWDCPCHGSRYDRLGKVIHSPAMKDLKRRHPGSET